MTYSEATLTDLTAPAASGDSRPRAARGALVLRGEATEHEPRRPYDALEARARGYVTKGSLSQDLLDAVRVAAKGGVFQVHPMARQGKPVQGGRAMT
jgi:DNA-binding NarL/FixJ family response regulator